jgi:hypothetical protein
MNVMLFVLNLCHRFGHAVDVGPKSERDAGTALFALGAMRGGNLYPLSCQLDLTGLRGGLPLNRRDIWPILPIMADFGHKAIFLSDVSPSSTINRRTLFVHQFLSGPVSQFCHQNSST